MKDVEIFTMLEQSTGLLKSDVIDFRPCQGIYSDNNIPKIKDAIVMRLKRNGTLVYIPERDTQGKPIQRKERDMRAKIVIQDGVLQGTFMTSDTVAAGLKLDIVSADSDVDSDKALRHELSEPHMLSINSTMRHPKCPDKPKQILKSYKDFEKMGIGASDYATLILSGSSDTGLEISKLAFGKDGTYKAYIVKGEAIIADHYEKKAEFKTWMNVYDDNGLARSFKGDQIIVYRAFEMGCIIQIFNERED